MMRSRYFNKAAYIIIAGTLALTCCTKPYNPPAIKGATGYLVVEGVIDAGNDTTKFQLSRTVGLGSDTTLSPVTGATVVIQGNDNSSYPLNGNSSGIYSAPPLGLNASTQYRIDIKTPDGKEYQSDYVPVKITPSIDSVSTVIEPSGLQVNVNTHDPANNTRYYRWNYTETWEFHAKYFSDYESNGDTVLYRQPADQIYFCYSSDNATNILLGSSAKLTQDVISTAPITFVPATSEKVETDYSILVRQYALTSDAYNFWTNLKKNTEQLGSIFDALPSQIDGNIHCLTDPNEPVIGYVSASTITTQRIFVNNTTLPSTWVATYPYQCVLDSFLFRTTLNGQVVYPEDQYFNWKKGAPQGEWVPISAIVQMGIAIGHTGTYRECGDCSVRGSLIKPSYWQ
jgi:hypothetical protein